MSERPIAEVGPVACPFVAFEHDQARRSIEPDRRHRCYAEPVPAPRAISHQTTYCLSSGFAACPTFRAWAQRAAAGQVDPVPDTASRAPREVPVAPMPQTVDPATMAPAIDDARSTRAGMPAADADDDLASLVRPASAAAAGAVYGAAFGSAEAPGGEAAGDVPPFLSTRPPPAGSTPPDPAAAGRPRSGGQARPAARTLRRPARIDADAPAWEKPRRFEAYPTLRTRMGMPRVPTIAIAGVAVLAAALLLFVLPSMVAGPSATPTPTPVPSEASIAPVTPEPSPTPVTYVVVAGDTLSKIARKHGVTNDELLAANPQITNPNRIKVGDEIVIPAPASEAEPSTEASPESSPSP